MLARLRTLFERLTFRQKLFGLSALILVAVTLLIALQTMVITRSQESYQKAAVEQLRLRLAMQRIERYYGFLVGVAWAQWVANGSVAPDRALAELRSYQDTVADDWDTLLRLSDNPVVREQELPTVLWMRLPADLAVDRLEQILLAGNRTELRRFIARELEPAISPLLDWLAKTSDLIRGNEEVELATILGDVRQAQATSYAIVLGSLLLLFVTASWMLRDVYRGIESLTAQARHIAARDFQARINHIPRGELGELAQAFVTMQEALALYESELRQRVLEARAANQAKSTFLAAMSHEIRTPLIGVLGMLEVLGRSKLEAEQRRRFNIVQQSARSLLEIIGDILDYSKIEADKVVLTPETVSIRDVVSRVVSNFSANAESRGLQMSQIVEAGVAPAHLADRMRLTQILSNFVGNAVKFTEQGSITVQVSVSASDETSQTLSFCVRDTGIGMTPEQVGKLFRPFSQSDAGTTRRFGGTGLGLVICQRLAELMGGSISVASDVDRGTTFTLNVKLPVGDPAALTSVAKNQEEQILARPKPTREQAEREGSLLLLAEDHPINRQVLTQQLDIAGFLVDTAENGALALEKFRAGAYGLVLTDLHMPELDGFELTAAIREFERENHRRHTPVIALTANVLREDVERCLSGGMDDYLSKPVTVRQLAEKLQQWLPDLDWGATHAEKLPTPTRKRPRASVPVDPTLVHQITGGDAGKMRELLQFYCQTTLVDLKALTEARTAGDGSVVRLAHRMKGAALMIGAHEVAGIAKRIEGEAAQLQEADVATLIDHLRLAVTRVDEYVRNL